MLIVQLALGWNKISRYIGWPTSGTVLNSLCKRQRKWMAIQPCLPTLNLVAVVSKEPVQINGQQLVLPPSCNSFCVLLCSSLRLYLKVSSRLLSLRPQPRPFPSSFCFYLLLAPLAPLSSPCASPFTFSGSLCVFQAFKEKLQTPELLLL